MRRTSRAVAAVSGELRLPDFIIGGAPRSGTTWLYHLLRRHPEVFLAAPVRPEPKFFLVDAEYERGLAYYSDRWFGDAGPDVVAGEKSTNYLESAVAAARIARHLPGVRLVFILREPAERAWSNYRWSRMNGLEDESFGRALAMEAAREAACPEELRYSRPYAYFSRGLYADLLEPYVSHYGPAGVLCLRFEDLVTDGGRVAHALHTFLGVAPQPEAAAAVGVVNPSEGSETIPSELAELRRRYDEPNRRLAKLLGPDFEIWESA
jgi:hypothetical protein